MRVDAQFFGLDRTGGTMVLLHYLGRAVDRGDEVHLTTLGTAADKRFVVPPAGTTATYVGLRRPLYRGLARLAPGDLGFPRWELRRLRGAARPAELRLASYTFTVLSSIDGNTPVYHHAQHMETLLETSDRRRRMILEGLRSDVYRTANCTWVAEQIDSIGGSVDGIVTPGIDLDTFTDEGLRHDAVDSSRDRPARVVTLGKAVEWKGLNDVIAAVSIVAHDRPIELITYGPDRPRVPRHVAHEHLGFVDPETLAATYRAADLCVVGSWYESFPLPPLEAMACGTPVVCTRIGTEDYASHERNCLIVPAQDPDAIASAIGRMLDDHDLRAHLRREGVRTAAAHGWSAAEARFLSHMDLAAGRRALR